MSLDEIGWIAVFSNLQRERSKWGRFCHILGWGGDKTRTSRRIYMAVVHYVLLFESESWFITPQIMWELGRLHNWVAWLISGQMPRCQNEKW